METFGCKAKNVLSLQRKRKEMVPWMSGLVSGLQNRLRRFEPARNLKGFG